MHVCCWDLGIACCCIKMLLFLVWVHKKKKKKHPLSWFIWLKKRSQDWTRLKPRARNSIQPSSVVEQTQLLEPSLLPPRLCIDSKLEFKERSQNLKPDFPVWSSGILAGVLITRPSACSQRDVSKQASFHQTFSVCSRFFPLLSLHLTPLGFFCLSFTSFSIPSCSH